FAVAHSPKCLHSSFHMQPRHPQAFLVTLAEHEPDQAGPTDSITYDVENRADHLVHVCRLWLPHPALRFCDRVWRTPRPYRACTSTRGLPLDVQSVVYKLGGGVSVGIGVVGDDPRQMPTPAMNPCVIAVSERHRRLDHHLVTRVDAQLKASRLKG